MKPAIILFLFFNLVKAQDINVCQSEKYRSIVWNQSTLRNVNPNGNELIIFCYKKPLYFNSFFKMWSSAKFSIRSSGDFEVYSGKNKTDIACQHESKSNLWLQTDFEFWKSNSISLNPLNESCIGVLSRENYDVILIIKALDIKLFLFYLLGCFLFLYAPVLCRTALFYYGTGISIGTCASLIIIAFILARFIPKKSVLYTTFIACFSFSAYLWNYFYSNFLSIVNHYHYYILAYISMVSFISFAFCYYRGPIENPRVFNLIQWTIQLASAALIYSSCQLSMFAVATVVVLISLGFILKVKLPLPGFLYKMRFRYFPPQKRFLTMEEYNNEGAIETRKALENLRSFCSSPECDAWKTVSRLRNPGKFAEWIDSDNDKILFNEDYDGLYMDSDDDEDYDDGS